MGQFSSLHHHLEKLGGFVAVAEAHSLSLAARRLRMTQPSLSHSMKVLEECLEISLFVRSSRGIELTDAGRALYELSTRLLAEVTELEERLRIREDAISGTLEIGTKAPYAVHFWPKHLDSLASLYPLLRIGLHVERTNSALIEQLLSRRLQLILIPEPEPSERLLAYEIFRDSYDFYLPPSTDERRSGLPLILFKSALSGRNRTLEQNFRRLRLDPARVWEVDSFEAARAMALQGLGMVVLPKSMGRADLLDGKLVRGSLPGVPRGFFSELKICLCLRAENARSPKLRAILHHLRASAAAG